MWILGLKGLRPKKASLNCPIGSPESVSQVTIKYFSAIYLSAGDTLRVR